MRALTDEEYQLNRSGILAPGQVKSLKRTAYFYILLSVVFAGCFPVTFFNWGTNTQGAVIFGFMCVISNLIFGWMAKIRLKLAACQSNCVSSIGGVLEIKIRGRNTTLRIGGKSFTENTYKIKGLKHGVRYEFFYSNVGVLGWKEMV